MKISIAFISLIAIILGYLYFFTGYKSAFEADQQCHYELRLKSVELEGLGCDHDIETINGSFIKKELMISLLKLWNVIVINL